MSKYVDDICRKQKSKSLKLNFAGIMPATYIKRYNRCKWMAIVSAIFTAMTISCLIPGAIGIAGLNHYNDTLLYLGLIDFFFAALFFIGWWSCQIEVDDVVSFTRDIPSRLQKKKRDSVGSQASSDSIIMHQLIQNENGGRPSHYYIKEA